MAATQAKPATRTQIVPAAARPIVIRQDAKGKGKEIAKKGKAAFNSAKQAAKEQEAVFIGAAAGGAIALAEAKMGFPTSGIADLGLGVGLLILGNSMKSDKIKAAAAGAAAVGGYKLGVDLAAKMGKPKAPVQGDLEGDLVGDIDGDLVGDLY